MTGKLQNKYRVASTRLENYDYGANGAYFVTICTKGQESFFGNNVVMSNKIEYQVQYSAIGKKAHDFWLGIPTHFPFVILDEFQIMPNHVHGILIIDKLVETQYFASQKQQQKTPYQETQNIASLQEYKNSFGPQSNNLSSIIRGYKSAVKKFATLNNIDFGWQERFYDRIIRDEKELNTIRRYIVANPDNWAYDENNLHKNL